MTEYVENLILEHLKRFQMSHDRIEAKLGEVVTRIGNLELSVAGCAETLDIRKKILRQSACAWTD